MKTNSFANVCCHCYQNDSNFFSFDGQNYARYLSYFSVFLANIDISHPGALTLIKRGAISVARSFIPGNRCDVDKTMEETFMRHAKSRSGAGAGGVGVAGIMNKYDAYQRWVRTTHARSLYVDATLTFANMIDSSIGKKHRSLRHTEILKGEKLVQKAKETICSFLNPFDISDEDKLVIISSGRAASTEVSNDVLNAEIIGEQARNEFIEERITKGENFFQPIKRKRLKTLTDMSKVKRMRSTNNKIVQFKQQGNIAFNLLVKSENQGVNINFEELMSYPLTPVPYSLATADGSLAKTDKSKAFHFISKDCKDAIIPASQDTLTIYDGNALFYCLKNLPANFSLICLKLFDMIIKTGDIVFSTDQYHPKSIKSMERQKRLC